MFKVKGEKHSSSKVKTLASVDIEKVNSINEFADTVVTESRLTQGLEYLKVHNISIEPKSTPVFLKWIADDVVKEETDTLVASHLEIKDVITRVKYVARTWFLAQEEM
jgi:ferritin